jgi:two-component system sensor histidine kinase PhoQ
VLLLLFFGATIAVLDTAFSEAGEQARRDILDGHLVALLGAAEPDAGGELALPDRLREPRFESIGSGLYAELRDLDGAVLWRSRSALGLEIPAGVVPEIGNHLFARESLEDDTPLLTLSLAVQWEFADGALKSYVFKVAESLDSFNAQVAGFRRQLFGWFAAVALTMLLAFSMLLRGLLKPLRQIETEITEIEEGNRGSLSGEFPTELTGVARNMNLLIDSERARSDRYRYTLDNLAHSLKTPLAAMRALLNDRQTEEFSGRVNEQIDRMDEIVRYQLRKPAASIADKHVLKPVPVEKEVTRLVDGLRKVYHEKNPDFDVQIQSGMQFRGDTGDFLELAGNLVSDDGPGIPNEAADALLQRGMRLDESTPGHGIGLAVVKDIARSYGGRLSIKTSDLGGAEIMVSIPPVS